jgi:hypothetical protein
MPFLIDCFSPAEMLHMVSVANRHQLLTTDQKRFLIGLRMAEVNPDGTYKITPEKVGKFNRIFGQFLNELKSGQRCDKEGCPTCDRLQELLDDFHGPQESPEFRSFIEWFQKSTLLYTPSEPTTPAAASSRPLSSPFSHSKQAAASIPSKSAAAVPSLAASLPATAFKGPYEDAAPLHPTVATPAPVPGPDRATAPIPQAEPQPPPAAIGDALAAGGAPLFQPNPQHPIVRRLQELLAADLGRMDDASLRRCAHQLQADCRVLLGGLVLATGQDRSHEA